MKPSILIVEARFYAHIADLLLDGATAALDAGGATFERISVPGALEIPVAIGFAAKAGEAGGKVYDGFVALGTVLRGETYHFEVVSNESARGLMDLGIHYGLCIGNGILTLDTEEQALVRGRRNGSDKGGDAARACLALIELRQKLGARR